MSDLWWLAAIILFVLSVVGGLLLVARVDVRRITHPKTDPND